MKPNHKA